jgi:hypothetical protein
MLSDRRILSLGATSMGHLGRTQKSRAASEKKLKAYACELEQKLEARTRELAEARGHLSEALEQADGDRGGGSSSPGELEPVFQAMLANAIKLCEGSYGAMCGKLLGRAIKRSISFLASIYFKSWIREQK